MIWIIMAGLSGKFNTIRLILGGGVLIIVLLYMAGNFVYNQFIATAPSVDLPFKDENGKKLHITNNRSAADKSYAEVLQFMKDDQTDRMSSSKDRYTVGDYIVRLHDNAEKKGIKAGVGEMALKGEYRSVYACNIFHTTDEGTIYVTSCDPFEDMGNDSIILISQYGELRGMTFYVPLANATGKSYKQLTIDDGYLGMLETVTKVNEIW